MTDIMPSSDTGHFFASLITISLKKFILMFGLLNDTDIEELLYHQFIGRIGCPAAGITYVVPINYAYDGVYNYGHKYEGMKTNMMRKKSQNLFSG